MMLQRSSRVQDIRTRLKAPDPRAVAAPNTYDATARTVEATVATDNPIKRYGGAEVLPMSATAADLSRAAGGRMAFLLNHDPDQPIGVVESVQVKSGQLVATLRFADTPEGRKAEGQVARSELSQFSIGYDVHSWDPPKKTGSPETWRAARWELFEVSLVSIPADKAATVRSLKGTRKMDPEDDLLERDERSVQTAPPSATARAAERAERQRAAAIADLGRRAGLEQLTVDQAVENGTTIDAFRVVVNEALLARQGPPISMVRVERDEGDARIRDMSSEIVRRMAGESAPRSPSSQRFMGLSLVEMAAESIGHRGRIGFTTADREDILRRAFHATSDFPMMFEGAINGRMAERYAAAQTTYRTLCKRRDLVDFRPAAHYRPGDMPGLAPVNPEGGEIKYGTFKESREYVKVESNAIAISFSRAMIVNDNYKAIDDVLNSYGTSVSATEERGFWTVVQSASGAGPTLSETSRPIFNATDGSMAASAAAINVASVSLGRAAMRKRKSIDGLFVQAEPKFIVAGPDKEREVDKLLAEISATDVANVNPFGGKLTKVITPEIAGNAWYLFADPERVAAFVYSLLEGYTAPRLRIDTPFGVQGLQASVEHDFGFGAVDFRGGYRNPGA